jgi:hypothetical protein
VIESFLIEDTFKQEKESGLFPKALFEEVDNGVRKRARSRKDRLMPHA